MFALHFVRRTMVRHTLWLPGAAGVQSLLLSHGVIVTPQIIQEIAEDSCSGQSVTPYENCPGWPFGTMHALTLRVR